jgi:hypothetical protein
VCSSSSSSTGGGGLANGNLNYNSGLLAPPTATAPLTYNSHRYVHNYVSTANNKFYDCAHAATAAAATSTPTTSCCSPAKKPASYRYEKSRFREFDDDDQIC